MPSKLKSEFDAAMMDIYLRAKSEAKYTATIFHRMLDQKRGLATAKQLISDQNVSQGYTALWERGRLDLTVEATVVDNEKYHSLFSPDELEKASKRLKAYGYFDKS